jgi:hypothetical protein
VESDISFEDVKINKNSVLYCIIILPRGSTAILWKNIVNNMIETDTL